ncbi:MAG: cation transporter [Coriobacteriales bacterium]|jgi:copper ion binding protein|nr:cation transporter [Coriobacteriales bacterium]
METQVKVEGMSCGHCTAAVEGEIAKIPGVETVKADLAQGLATVKHDGSVALDAIREAVEEAGFDVG